YLWDKVAYIAVYLYNRTLYSTLDYKTLYKVKFGSQLDADNINTIGSLVYFKRKP
ncbi:hypothetical protein B0H67DRAFT_499847, partial [Lasiosphaeris hirsuta]